MAQAYTPGLKVARRTLHRCRRVLPVSGEVLTSVGTQVRAQDVVAQTFLPGPITPVNVANQLSIPPSDVPAAMAALEGDKVAAGQLLARSKGMFGWFPKECVSPADGTIEAISGITGQVMIRGAPLPVELRAYLAGRVVEVIPGEGAIIEAETTLVQGIFGIGGEAYGPIRTGCGDAAENLTPGLIEPAMKGAIVIGGGRVTSEAITRAVQVGVAAIVTGGIDDQDLRDFLGYDLGVATTGSENVGLTLIITEGFGDIAMAERTFKLLASRAGCDAAVNGATQIRAGVLRPEVVVPWGTEIDAEGVREQEAGVRRQEASGVLAAGTAVRIIRDPHFGIIGTVAALPSEPRVLGSGSKARVLEVRLPSGDTVVVPRANVELIED
jgi:hypothetical protein